MRILLSAEANVDNIVVRPMREADYDAAVELWKSTDGIGLSEADNREDIFRYLVRNPEMSQVAEADGQLAGAVLCGHDGRRGYLNHLAVAQPYRSMGVGRQLVQACMTGLLVQGIARCHLFVFPDNELGQAFWRKMGFEQRNDIRICSRDL